MKIKASQILKIGKCRIEKGWVQGYYAIDNLGKSCHPLSISANGWCIIGSLCGDYDSESWLLSIEYLMSIINNCKLSIYNDDINRTKEDILNIFNKAIKIAEINYN